MSVPSRGWLFGTPERMQEMIELGRVQFGADETKVPTLKRYLKETEYEAPYSVIYKDGRAASKRLASLMGDKVFDNPKDVEVIKELIGYLRDPDCIVMDFFSGSGTTAEAIMEMNAQAGGKATFILIQYPENLSERLTKTTKTSAKKVIENAIALCEDLGGSRDLTTIAEERIRRAGAKIAAEVAESNVQLRLGEEPKPVPDIGFRVLRIDSSNFRSSRTTPDDTEQATLMESVDNVKEGRGALDLLFQVLPAFRIPYTASIEELDLKGRQVFDVNGGQLLACFDANIGEEVVEAMARRKPSYAIVRDVSFRNSSAAANFEELFKTFSPDTVRRVI